MPSRESLPIVSFAAFGVTEVVGALQLAAKRGARIYLVLDRAPAHNLELGALLHDPAVVRRTVHHFRSLMHPDAGPLDQVPIGN